MVENHYKKYVDKIIEEGIEKFLITSIDTRRIQAYLGITREKASVVKTLLQDSLKTKGQIV